MSTTRNPPNSKLKTTGDSFDNFSNSSSSPKNLSVATFNPRASKQDTVFSPLQRPSKSSSSFIHLLKNSAISAGAHIWNHFSGQSSISQPGEDTVKTTVHWDYVINFRSSQPLISKSNDNSPIFLKSFVDFLFKSSPFASKLNSLITPSETIQLSPQKIQHLLSYYLALLVSEYGLIIQQDHTDRGSTRFLITAPFTVLAQTAQSIGLEKVKRNGSVGRFTFHDRWSFQGYSNPHTFWTPGERVLLIQHILQASLAIPVPKVCPSIQLVGLPNSSAVSGYSNSPSSLEMLTFPSRVLDFEFYKFFLASVKLHEKGKQVLLGEDAVFFEIFSTVNSFKKKKVPPSNITSQSISSANAAISSSFRIDLLGLKQTPPTHPPLPQKSKSSDAITVKSRSRLSKNTGSIHNTGPLPKPNLHSLQEVEKLLRHTSSESNIASADHLRNENAQKFRASNSKKKSSSTNLAASSDGQVISNASHSSLNLLSSTTEEEGSNKKHHKSQSHSLSLPDFDVDKQLSTADPQPSQGSPLEIFNERQIKEAMDLLAPPSVLARVNSLSTQIYSYPQDPLTGNTWELPHSGSLISLKSSLHPPLPLQTPQVLGSSAPSILSQLEKWGLVESFHPVHHPLARKALWNNWKTFNFKRNYRYSQKHIEILDSCQQYLGPDLCFYFTFLFGFTSSLFVPGLIALIFFFLGVGSPPSSTKSAHISVTFAAFIAFWSIHVIYLARKSHTLTRSLCSSQFTQSYVHKWYDSLISIPNLNTQFQFKVRQIFSIFITLLLCSLSVFCYLFYANVYHSVIHWNTVNKHNALVSALALNIPVIFYTLFVFKFASLSKPWFAYLNEWECAGLEIPSLTRHNSLIYKRFLFELINSFTAPYHLLFIQNNVPEFKSHLFYFFVTKPLVSLFVEFLIPTFQQQYYIHSKASALRAKESEMIMEPVLQPAFESTGTTGSTGTRKDSLKFSQQTSNDNQPKHSRRGSFKKNGKSSDSVKKNDPSSSPKDFNSKSKVFQSRGRRNSLSAIKDMTLMGGSGSGLKAKHIQAQVLSGVNEDFSRLRQRIKSKTHNASKKVSEMKTKIDTKTKSIYNETQQQKTHLDTGDSSFDPYLGSYDDYLEIILNFGFCLCFGSIYPLCIVSCLLNNIFESKTDLYKFLFVYTRPRFSPPGTAWIHILVLLQYIGVFTQTAIFTLTPWSSTLDYTSFTEANIFLLQNLFFAILVLIYNFPIQVPVHVQKKLPNHWKFNSTSDPSSSSSDPVENLVSTWPIRTAFIFGIRALASRVRSQDLKDWSNTMILTHMVESPSPALPSSPIVSPPTESALLPIPVTEGSKSGFQFFKRTFSGNDSRFGSAPQSKQSFPVALKKMSFLRKTSTAPVPHNSISPPTTGDGSLYPRGEKKSFRFGSKKLMSQTTSVFNSMSSVFMPKGNPKNQPNVINSTSTVPVDPLDSSKDIDYSRRSPNFFAPYTTPVNSSSNRPDHPSFDPSNGLTPHMKSVGRNSSNFAASPPLHTSPEITNKPKLPPRRLSQ